MAITAIAGGRKVSGVFARRGRPVVAGRARAGDIVVVESRRRPGRLGVTL